MGQRYFKKMWKTHGERPSENDLQMVGNLHGASSRCSIRCWEMWNKMERHWDRIAGIPLLFYYILLYTIFLHYIILYYMCIYIYISMYLCIHVSMYLCIYVSMYASMYLCIYVSMYVCMHACMYVCLYIP